MKVFVTGHKGYIGAHLIQLLKEAGHYVTGCDLNLFLGCEWETLTQPDRELCQDIRTLTPYDLEGHDCVMHLAAISNDPMGELKPEITHSINRDGSILLAQAAKRADVPRFLFSSSCSTYGKGENLDLDETANLNPVSAYAISKIKTEKAVSAMADTNFSPVFLRNATAYGHSPMLRIDLVANNLLACAFTTGAIRIMSDGTPWRPLIHCKDIARAFVAFMQAPREKVHNRAVNVGANEENYQVRDVANVVKQFLPQSRIEYTGEIGEDPRDYRVNFDLFRSLLPDFRMQYNLETGLEQLFSKFKDHHFSLQDFEGDAFVRLRTLKQRLIHLEHGWKSQTETCAA